MQFETPMNPFAAEMKKRMYNQVPATQPSSLPAWWRNVLSFLSIFQQNQMFTPRVFVHT